MQLKTSDTENKKTEPQILFIHSDFSVDLHPENEVTREEAVFYEAPADGGFVQNTTAWD